LISTPVGSVVLIVIASAASSKAKSSVRSGKTGGFF